MQLGYVDISAPAKLSLTDWSFEPTVVVGLLALSILYVVALRRGAFDTDGVRAWLRSPAWRPYLFGLGMLISYIALQSPIDRGGDEYLLSIHMVQHLLLMMCAPPFLLLGIAGSRPWSPSGWRRLRSAWRAVTRPWAACALFNAVLLIWHVPALYNTTLTVEPLHVFEHLTFIAAGIIFWWPIVDPFDHPGTQRISPLTKIAMLVIAGIPPTILGFIFAMGRTPFYPFYAVAPRLWGLSPLADQQIAGVVMFGVGNVIYFVAISVIFLRLFGDPASDEGSAVLRGVEAGTRPKSARRATGPIE